MVFDYTCPLLHNCSNHADHKTLGLGLLLGSRLPDRKTSCGKDTSYIHTSIHTSMVCIGEDLNILVFSSLRNSHVYPTESLTVTS